MPYMLDGRRLRVGRPFTLSDGRQFGSQWTRYTTDELTALGITYEADPAPFDSKYYFSVGNPRDVAELKTYFTAQQKNTAAAMLSKTDWYVIRKSETDTAIPSVVTTYRAAVRTACAARETQIAAVTTTEALETLMKALATLENGDANPAALTQWPEALS
jgi:hypothetical protein